MSRPAALSGVEVVHSAVPGRLRLRHPQLKHAPRRCARVQAALAARRGVHEVRISELTGSVLIVFDAPQTVERLAQALADVLAGRVPGEAHAARESTAELPPRGAAARPSSDPSGPGLAAKGATGAPVARAAKATKAAGRPAPASASATGRPPAKAMLPAAPGASGLPAPAADPADDWHVIDPQAALRRAGTPGVGGLSTATARERLGAFGPNRLAQRQPRSAAQIFFAQFRSLPIALLSGSALLSLATGGIGDAIVIAGVVALNATIAAVTERRAERTIMSLADFGASPVAVWRDGQRGLLAPDELVPGDVIELVNGSLIAADARLLSSDELTINESALTGEALPVRKEAACVLGADTVLAERANRVFRGTAVTGGSGLAVVTHTGGTTQIGQIQRMLGSVEPPATPIQRQLEDIERELVYINGAICVAVFGLGLLRGEGLLPVLRRAISLAVAAIPEGLPAVATTTLALGIQKMRSGGVLVRTLDAVETLGAVEVIGLDKTGTLTENRMAVVALHVDGRLLALGPGGGLADAESLPEPGAEAAALPPEAARRCTGLARAMLATAALCSEAELAPAGQGDGDGFEGGVRGSATEAALVQAAMVLGVDVAGLRGQLPLQDKALRAEGRKRMSTLHRGPAGPELHVKGDPAEVLARCTRVLAPGGPQPLTPALRAAIAQANHRMAGRALRVLGMACAPNGADPRNERDLVWLGLAGLADPVRPGVPQAIGMLHGAGIKTVMITGDQSATAQAIARQLHLGQSEEEIRVLEAGQMRSLDPEVLAALAAHPDVFARVTPAEKLAIVRALQARGRVVAMTGDGVNDGPALKAAHVGIAMGARGSDVAREVADIVLARDDLQGVVEAVRLGRATYFNIRKVLRFLIGTNASETMLMLGSSLAGWPEPLKPMQLLWLNLVTDVLPALALGLEPPEPDVLQQAPHDPGAPILQPADFRRLLAEGAVLGATTLAGFLAVGGPGAAGGPASAGLSSTVAFHGLTVSQLLHALACRNEKGTLRGGLIGPQANPQLLGALGLCLLVQLGAQGLPFTRRLLGLAPLGPRGWLAVAGIVAGSALASEINAALWAQPVKPQAAAAPGPASAALPAPDRS